MTQERDDFDPVGHRRGLLEARSTAMEYVAHKLGPSIDIDDALDDATLDLLVDVAAALAAVGLPLRQHIGGPGISVDRWPNRDDGRPQANVCWYEGAALLDGPDYQAWESAHDAMTDALTRILQGHHFEVEHLGTECVARRPFAGRGAGGEESG